MKHLSLSTYQTLIAIYLTGDVKFVPSTSVQDLLDLDYVTQDKDGFCNMTTTGNLFMMALQSTIYNFENSIK